MNEFLERIYEYQKINNIKNECVTNAQILYQYINANNLGDCSCNAVIAVCEINSNHLNICCPHFVVEFNNGIIDPSFEIKILPNNIYYKDYSTFINETFGIGYTGEYAKKKYEKMFIKFQNLAIKINKTKKLNRLNIEYFNQLSKLI
jgi:hypothetical protein